MNQLTQTASFIASEISSIESRERKRSADSQKHFEHAIECLLKKLWLGTAIYPEYEVGIHMRSNCYSETPLAFSPSEGLFFFVQKNLFERDAEVFR